MYCEKDYYAILGLNRFATEKQIHDKYRALVKIAHPDICRMEGIDAGEILIAINEAYGVLSEQREEYDAVFFTMTNVLPLPPGLTRILKEADPNYKEPAKKIPMTQTSYEKQSNRYPTGKRKRERRTNPLENIVEGSISLRDKTTNKINNGTRLICHYHKYYGPFNLFLNIVENGDCVLFRGKGFVPNFLPFGPIAPYGPTIDATGFSGEIILPMNVELELDIDSPGILDGMIAHSGTLKEISFAALELYGNIGLKITDNIGITHIRDMSLHNGVYLPDRPILLTSIPPERMLDLSAKDNKGLGRIDISHRPKKMPSTNQNLSARIGEKLQK